MSNWISKNAYLTTVEMQNNAQIVYDRLINGFTKNAICAMLANMQCESNINPGIWEGLNADNKNGGFGLVQWTPSTKYTEWHNSYFGDTSYTDGDKQLSRIIYELNYGLQWASSYSPNGLTFREFSTSTLDPYVLAVEFLLCYERPEDQSESVRALRGSIARTWWNFFGGGDYDSGGVGGEGGGSVDPPTPDTTVYSVTVVPGTLGTVVASMDTAPPGTSIRISTAPESGYIVGGVSIHSVYYGILSYVPEGNGVYSFTMPRDNVRILVTFVEEKKPFPLWILFKFKGGII